MGKKSRDVPNFQWGLWVIGSHTPLLTPHSILQLFWFCNFYVLLVAIFDFSLKHDKSVVNSWELEIGRKTVRLTTKWWDLASPKTMAISILLVPQILKILFELKFIFEIWIAFLTAVFDIGDGLMWKMKPWPYFFISIARRPQGNYFFPLWNRGNVACHRSQLTIFQYEKPFAQAANWNLNRNLLGANCQSKYQHCMTILQSGAQTNNRFHCNPENYLII